MQGQIQPSPCWRNELCRSNDWPEDEWYLGFAEGMLIYRANVAESRSMLEQQARGKMVESIRMDVSSRTEIETKSEFQSDGGFNNETINKVFAETIQVTAGAEVINTFTDSYQDSNAKKSYAFAAVKKADLAAYYEAEVVEAKDVMVVFVTGTESIKRKKIDIIVSGLQTILHDNDIRVTEKQEEAGYILKIDANVCNLKFNKNFHYANACVKVVQTNTKTNVNEVIASITGPKEGGLSVENAGEKALRAAIPDVWAKVKDKILEDL